MLRWTVSVICVFVLVTAGYSQPNQTDTRLLSQPAVSGHHVAFIYADDLFVCDLDGQNVRRLTSDQKLPGWYR